MDAVEDTRARFRPERITTLFVGESAPASGDFFYYGNNAMFRHMQRAVQRALGEDGDFLQRFKGYGWYLDDLVLTPVNKLTKSQREAKWFDDHEQRYNRFRLIGRNSIREAVLCIQTAWKRAYSAVVDVVAGRVAIMFDAAPSLLAFILAGKLRPLAVASGERILLLPDIPTFAEIGYPGMDISLWYGVVAPAGTPQTIVQRLNVELVKILGMDDIRESFAKQAADPAGGTPEQFDEFMRAESARWGKVIRAANVKPE